MESIHRKQITEHELDKPFKAPKNCTFGWQEGRKAFSLWFKSSDPMDTEYIIVGTGHEFLSLGHLRHSVVMPDGFHVFYLVEIV